jgi:hypothetical protein
VFCPAGQEPRSVPEKCTDARIGGSAFPAPTISSASRFVRHVSSDLEQL